MDRIDDLRDLIAAVRLSSAVAGAFVLVLVVTAAGSPLLWEPWPRLHLDREGGVPAFVSASLLVLAGVLSVLACFGRPPRVAPAAVGAGLAVLFGFMAVDEWAHLHERLQGAGGLDWPIVYLPVMLVAGAMWLFMLRQLPRGPAAVSWCAGAGAWATATFLEQFLYGPNDEQIALTMTIEEMFELAGSAAFAVALLTAIRSVVRVPVIRES